MMKLYMTADALSNAEPNHRIAMDGSGREAVAYFVALFLLAPSLCGA
jgi:hypothetical protein